MLSFTGMASSSQKNSSSAMSTNEKEEEEDTQCGIGSCKPRPLQPMANLLIFTGFYSVVATTTNTLGSLLSSQITSLEKQFNLNSTMSGFLLSSNEIGYLVVVLLMSHFGKNANIPKILGATGMIFGFAAICTGLTNFITPFHLPSESQAINTTNDNNAKYLCNRDLNESSLTPVSKTRNHQDMSSTWAPYFISVCMVFYGISKTPRNSLAGVYIDNNIKDKAKSSIYIGAVFSAMIFGPSVGLIVGSGFAKLPVDLRETYMTPTDPRWVGAWWISFLLFGCVGILMSIPVLCIPRRLPGTTKSQSLPSESNIFQQVKDLPLSLYRVLKSPVYAISIVNSIFYGFAISGFISFGPKYLEHQFNVPAWRTSLILGVSHVVTSGVGTFLGGVFAGKFILTRQGCLKFIMVTHLISLGLNAALLVLGCNNTPVEGFDYFRNDSQSSLACNCEKTPFLPVCGSDHVTYSSPCQAGCQNQTGNVYNACSRVDGMTVTPGICESGCTHLYPYVVTQAIQSLTATLAIMPHVMVFLRSVQERDKSMALGIYNFVSTLLGWMPAPIVYGKVIDSACKILRHTSSKRFGACSLYDIEGLRFKVFGLEVSLKVVAFVFLIASFFVCRWEDNRNKLKENRDAKKNMDIVEDKTTKNVFNEAAFENCDHKDNA